MQQKIDFSLLQRHTVELYNLEEKEYIVQDVPARSLLSGQRFDLFAKLYYIRNRHVNNKLAREVYCHHIKAFNPDLKEPGREDKNGYDDFLNSFDALIDDLGTNGFNPDKSLIPVDTKGIILDGAHRLSVLAYADKSVRIVRFNEVVSNGCFDYEYFLKRGLNWRIADLIAAEMVQWSSNMLIACLWPRMGSKEVKKETLNLINEQYPLCYDKTINTNLESFVRFIAKVYEAQPWVGDESNHFAGARHKALNCFAANKQITFALFEADKLDDIIAFKENIRQRFQSEKHSIHITDNVEETREIAAVVFDEEQQKKWNKLNNAGLVRLREAFNERLFYFQNVTFINWKVAVARMLNCIRK